MQKKTGYQPFFAKLDTAQKQMLIMYAPWI